MGRMGEASALGQVKDREKVDEGDEGVSRAGSISSGGGQERGPP